MKSLPAFVDEKHGLLPPLFSLGGEGVKPVDQPRAGRAVFLRVEKKSSLPSSSSCALPAAPMSKMLHGEDAFDDGSEQLVVLPLCLQFVVLFADGRQQGDHALVLTLLEVFERVDKAVLAQQLVAPVIEREDRQNVAARQPGGQRPRSADWRSHGRKMREIRPRRRPSGHGTVPSGSSRATAI